MRFRTAAYLDRPATERYFLFWRGFVTGDLGESLVHRRPVVAILSEQGANTLRLVVPALVVVLLVGLGVPVLLHAAGCRRAASVMEAALLVPVLVPTYVLGVTLLVAVGVVASGAPVAVDPGRPWSHVLPILVLAAYPTAQVARVFGEGMRSSLRQRYIMRALTEGRSLPSVILVEALPNALPRAAGAFANAGAYLATSTVFVEYVFGVPGIGRLVINSAQSRDVTLLLPVVVIIGAAVLAIRSVAELAASWRLLEGT